MYDPQSHDKVTFAFHFQINAPRWPIFNEPIAVYFEYHMPIPESWSKKKKERMVHLPHFGKPDLSNLIKFTEDALNGVAWKDDSLIYEIYGSKKYSYYPKTIIIVEKATNFPLNDGTGGNAFWLPKPMC